VSYGPVGAERAGILANEQIFDLEKAMQTAGAEAPVSDMRLFLEQPAWRSALDRAYATRDKVTPVALSTVRLGAPVPVPRSLIIAGANTKTQRRGRGRGGRGGRPAPSRPPTRPPTRPRPPTPPPPP